MYVTNPATIRKKHSVMTKGPHFNQPFYLFYPAPQVPIYTLKITIFLGSELIQRPACVFSSGGSAGHRLGVSKRIKGNLSYLVKAGDSGISLPKIGGTVLNYQQSPPGNSPAVQWLGLHTFTADGPGSIPGRALRSHKCRGTAKKKKKN